MMDKHTLALGAALGATGVEVYCVYDGLQNATGAQLAAGIGIAILAPLIPAYFDGARRYFAMVVFAFALACIIVVSGSRVGGAIDRAQQTQAQAARASKLAEESKQELDGLLTEARATAKAACPDAKAVKPPKACADARNRVDDLQKRLSSARTTLAGAPIIAGDGDVARVAAWTGGLLTEHQVSLYLPLLWPVTMALVGAFFWGVWGDGRPKTASVVEQQPAKPIKTPAPQPQSAPMDGDVVDILLGIVKPADRRKRVEIEEVHRAYVDIRKAQGREVAADESFVAQAKAFVEAANIRTLASGGKLYWCGVKLVA